MYTKLKLYKQLNEFKYNNFKPGFLNQMSFFKKFCINKNFKIINNIKFANKIIALSAEIYKF